MTESRWWQSFGCTYKRILNIFDTSSVSDCACTVSNLPDADGDVHKAIDFEQLREFRQAQWAKRKLGEACGQAWVNDYLILSKNGMALSALTEGTNPILCSGGDVLHEYH